jgi:hypothetical protein
VVEIEGRVLRITFDNINLPWADLDEPASHGFFNFFISQQPDLPNGTQILNDAAIYFDFNEAVITNNHLYTINTMLTSNNNLTKLNFSVQPNPAKEVIHIVRGTDFQSGELQVELRNVHGQVVLQALMTDNQLSLPLNELANGIYFVELEAADSSRGVQKVVVVR